MQQSHEYASVPGHIIAGGFAMGINAEVAVVQGRLEVPLDKLVEAVTDNHLQLAQERLSVPLHSLREQLSGKATQHELADGRIQVDDEAQTVTVEQQAVRLRNQEYKLLSFLARHPNIILGSETIYVNTWPSTANPEFLGDYKGTVKVHTKRIRDAIGTISPELANIQTGAIQTRPGLGIIALSSLKSS